MLWNWVWESRCLSQIRQLINAEAGLFPSKARALPSTPCYLPKKWYCSSFSSTFNYKKKKTPHVFAQAGHKCVSWCGCCWPHWLILSPRSPLRTSASIRCNLSCSLQSLTRTSHLCPSGISPSLAGWQGFPSNTPPHPASPSSTLRSWGRRPGGFWWGQLLLGWLSLSWWAEGHGCWLTEAQQQQSIMRGFGVAQTRFRPWPLHFLAPSCVHVTHPEMGWEFLPHRVVTWGRAKHSA